MVTIPENKKVEPSEKPKKMKVWVYGAPYSGKTTFADSFPNALILSTDGNTQNCTSPSMLIRDQVTTSGRLTTVQPAWKYFREIVDELAKGGNSYETIVLDLADDAYELCRSSKCADLGIKHESDDSTKAWDIVRSEFMITMRKLANLDYHIVWISHEDIKTDFMSRGGDNIKAINPSMQAKVANKLSGLVDMTIRAVEENGEYKLKIKENEIMFGGCRIAGVPTEIPNNFNDFENLYKKTRSEKK